MFDVLHAVTNLDPGLRRDDGIYVVQIVERAAADIGGARYGRAGQPQPRTLRGCKPPLRRRPRARQRPPGEGLT
ncbi:hypothetical protein V6768_23730, partial [Tistrella mobilis]